MFQLYLPEMHMDAKLQVILKGILVTEEDGVNFSGFFFIIIIIFSKIIWSLFACHQKTIGYPGYM